MYRKSLLSCIIQPRIAIGASRSSALLLSTGWMPRRQHLSSTCPSSSITSTTSTTPTSSTAPLSTELYSKKEAESSPPPPTALKRFYKHASTDGGSHPIHILLDGRRLKTPSGNVIAIPSTHALLADMIAWEWEVQPQVLKAHTLPLTSIASRAIDALAEHHSNADLVSSILAYLHTDSICYGQDYPSSFVDMQSTFWAPVLRAVQEVDGFPVVTTTGFSKVSQSLALEEHLRTLLSGLDPISLAAFEKAVLTTKSVFLAHALYMGRIDIEHAAQAARLEVMHQISKWGEVEDAHDVDAAEMKRQLGACCAAWVITPPVSQV